MRSWVRLSFLVGLVVACERDPGETPPAALLQAPFEVTPTMPIGSTATETSDASAPRRGYGPVDMKVSPCMSIEKDRITGKACPSSIVVFGPYVDAPPNSDVDISFEVEAKTRIAVFSDVVSSRAQKFHGALLEQWIDAGEKRWCGYRVHLFNTVASLETRIFVRVETPGDFTIHHLLINVH